jgi:hypothetical protein
LKTFLLKHTSHPPDIPPAQAPNLYKQANILWQNAPWEYLWDHQVIAIELINGAWAQFMRSQWGDWG